MPPSSGVRSRNGMRAKSKLHARSSVTKWCGSTRASGRSKTQRSLGTAKRLRPSTSATRRMTAEAARLLRAKQGSPTNRENSAFRSSEEKEYTRAPLRRAVPWRLTRDYSMTTAHLMIDNFFRGLWRQRSARFVLLAATGIASSLACGSDNENQDNKSTAATETVVAPLLAQPGGETPNGLAIPK